MIVLLYFALACFYALRTPIFLKPDEARHFDYVRYIKMHHALPMVDPSYSGIKGRPHYEIEGHQPPLYYTLLALLTFWDDMSDAQRLFRPNPHYLGSEHGNKNPFAPSKSRSEASFYAGRFVSLLFGSVAVMAVYLAAREFLPPGFALTAMAIMAFNPQFLFISTSFSNGASVTALIALGLWQAVRILKSELTGKRALLLGITAGLATLFKLSGLLLLIVIPFVGIWRILKGDNPKGGLGRVGLALMLGLAIPSSWFWRNQRLYGDPLAQNALLIMYPKEAPFGLADVGRFLRFVGKAYWLDFSPGGILFADPWFYFIPMLFAGAGFVGAIAALAHRRELRAYWGLCILWITTVLLATLSLIARFDLFVEGGRWLLPASPAVALLTALGIWELIPLRLARPLALAIPALWSSLAAFALAFYLLPEYSLPPTYPSEEGLRIPHPTFVSMEDRVAILGYEVDRAEAKAGEEIEVTIYWKALKPMDEDYSVFVQLLRRDGCKIAQLDTYPGMGLYPTSRWREGQVVKDSYALRVPQAISMPIECRIIAGMYDLSIRARLRAFDAQGNELDPLTLARIVLRPTEPLKVAQGVRLPQPLRFGGGISLVGKEVRRADHGLKVILWWRSEGEVGEDYTVFVHLLSEDGRIRAQGDSQPMGGNSPTSIWRPGEVIKDEHFVPLPLQGEGEYRIVVGMYLLETGERLPVGEGGDSILLGKVRATD